LQKTVRGCIGAERVLTYNLTLKQQSSFCRKSAILAVQTVCVASSQSSIVVLLTQAHHVSADYAERQLKQRIANKRRAKKPSDEEDAKHRKVNVACFSSRISSFDCDFPISVRAILEASTNGDRDCDCDCTNTNTRSCSHGSSHASFRTRKSFG